MAKRPRDSVEREIMDIIPERFDADSGSMGARRGAHTRLILTIALALLALAAVGIVARVLLVGEGQQIAADATVPVIKPDDKPIKTKPEDRGGMAVPNQDKLVYKDVGKDDTPAEPEKLLPPAEKPQVPAAKPGAMPAKDANAMPPPPAAGGSDVPAPPPAAAPSAPAPPPASAAPVPTVTASAVPAAPAAVDTKKNDAATAAPTPAPAPGRAPKSTVAASPTPTPAKPTTTASAAPASAPSAPKPAASAGSGAYQVQLAAMKSEADAQAVWKKVSTANKDLLGSLTDEIVQADLGAKGIYYRLRVGPLDEAAAKSLCAELAKRNQVCLVARK